MTPLQTVLELVDGARKTGKGWSAKCPAHEDGKASLSITEGTDGRVLLYCHAGCDFGSIVKAWGLEEGALFPSKDASGKHIVAEYTYTDEVGAELFQAVRFEPKDFRQRHRGLDGAWTWNLNGTRRVLYHLSELLEAVKVGATIFVVEGEKDVEALRALGLVATCNPMGAGKWRDEYADAFRGARVEVIADKDKAGRDHAERVAASLKGKAASVRVIEVPEGKDAADWIASGATREDFERLSVPTDDADAPPSPWINLDRFREELRQVTRTRMSTKIPTLDRATEGGVSGDMVVLLVGPPGSGKTVLSHQLARDRARSVGGRAYVYAPDQGGAQPLKRLASTFGNVAEDDDAFARFVASVEPTLRVVDERQGDVTIESFRDAVLAAGDVAAVVIDTPQTVATAENEEERQRIEKTMGIAREIAERLLVPVFICSHANRASTAARAKEHRTLEISAGLGAAATAHRAQVVLFMERRDISGRTEIDVMIPKAAIAFLRFRLLLDVGAWTLYEIDIANTTGEVAERAKKAKVEKLNTARTERREAIMAVVLAGPTEAGVSWARILEGCGGRAEYLKRTRDVMVGEKLLEVVPGPKPERGGKTPDHYRVRQAPPVDHSRSDLPEGMNDERSIIPFPAPLGCAGMIDLSPNVPGHSEHPFSTGTIDGNDRPGAV